jgi:hypothetical protein
MDWKDSPSRLLCFTLFHDSKEGIQTFLQSATIRLLLVPDLMHFRGESKKVSTVVSEMKPTSNLCQTNTALVKGLFSAPIRKYIHQPYRRFHSKKPPIFRFANSSVRNWYKKQFQSQSGNFYNCILHHVRLLLPLTSTKTTENVARLEYLHHYMRQWS